MIPHHWRPLAHERNSIFKCKQHTCTLHDPWSQKNITTQWCTRGDCLQSLKPRSQPAVFASACFRLAKTWAKFNSRIPPLWGCGSTQSRLSMFSARGTFSAFELRVGYGFTACTDDERALYVHERITHSLQIITCSPSRARNKCVVRTWSVCGLCFLTTSSVQLSKKRTKLRRTLSSTYIIARCAHWPTPNNGRKNSPDRTYNGLAS